MKEVKVRDSVLYMKTTSRSNSGHIRVAQKEEHNYFIYRRISNDNLQSLDTF